MNENAAVFKPSDVTFILEDKEYRLVYDLNAFCELEKIYESVDSVLQMLLGTSNVPDLDAVTYQGAQASPDDVLISGVPLRLYINKINKVPICKHSDTLNLVWLGMLHDHAEYDKHGEITGYTISKSRIGSIITFKNIREINAKILVAILRDLVPSEQVKNADAPEADQAK